jgi:hypothetical protein
VLILCPTPDFTPARWVYYVRALTLFSIFLVAATASADGLMFPAPPGAELSEHVILSPGVSEQDYFWIKASYPDTPALAHYSKIFDGWLECKPWKPGWDGRGEDNRYIHRFVRNWINVENNRTVTLLFQYSSPGSKHRAHPDNDRQFVAVIRDLVPNAEWHFAQIRIDCTKARNSVIERGLNKRDLSPTHKR